MTIRTLLIALVVTAGTGLLVPACATFAQDAPVAAKPRPRVEVVFCLDTTGSMGGLIDSAKQKIWSICNQIAAGKPTPELKVGLVAFRDRGDDYITKTFDLSDDLDAIHGHLMGFQAAGGGDEPESVNEALHVALNSISWSKEPKVLRIIYLVGDAPPHMDYPNDIPYMITCKKASERGIIINTVQCGNITRTTPFWKDIARLAEGRFVQIAHDGGVIAISTPFDKRLAEINAELANTSVVYGDQKQQLYANGQIARQSAPPAVAGAGFGGGAGGGGFGGAKGGKGAGGFGDMAKADRAGFNAKNSQVGAWDLIDSIKAGKVKLEDLKTEELPEQMRKLDLTERKAYLAKIESARSTLQTEALELDRKRSEHITRELSRQKGNSSFDAQVMEILREQAKKVNIVY